MPLELVRVPITHPDALRLVEEVQGEYRIRYGGPGETPLDPGMFARPRGAFFVGYVEEVPVAMGGWRRRDDVIRLGRTKAAEIKRMYVVPAVRRAGLASLVLRHLEDTARDAGADLMVLETGVRQPEAIGLYLASGYVPVDGFGYYKDHPNSRCFGKPL